jgi:hypothetical protein
MYILPVQEEYIEDSYSSIYIPFIKRSRRNSSDGFFSEFLSDNNLALQTIFYLTDKSEDFAEPAIQIYLSLYSFIKSSTTSERSGFPIS